MTDNEYQAARAALGCTHVRIAETIGVSVRTSFRYANGDAKIPEPTARLLRLLVLLRLTVSTRKFNELVSAAQVK
jgi:transcriptional regulator with XRE-family HTH domain